jgi:hypothetical protein
MYTSRKGDCRGAEQYDPDRSNSYSSDVITLPFNVMAQAKVVWAISLEFKSKSNKDQYPQQ